MRRYITATAETAAKEFDDKHAAAKAELEEATTELLGRARKSWTKRAAEAAAAETDALETRVAEVEEKLEKSEAAAAASATAAAEARAAYESERQRRLRSDAESQSSGGELLGKVVELEAELKAAHKRGAVAAQVGPTRYHPKP